MDRMKILFLFCLVVAVSSSIGCVSAAGLDIGVGNDIITNIIQQINTIPVGPSANNIVTASHSIQDAVDAAQPGDTILVHRGTYTENIVIDKPLKIIAAPFSKPTIKAANNNLPVILINPGGSGTEIRGLTLTGSSYSEGILINSANNCQIIKNTIKNNEYAIYTSGTSNTQISCNIINDNYEGLLIMDYSNNNKVTRNIISGNSRNGIWISDSQDNQVIRNTISKNWLGIHIANNPASNEAHYNIIIQNTLWAVINVDSTGTFNAQRNYWGFGSPKTSGLVDTSNKLYSPVII